MITTDPYDECFIRQKECDVIKLDYIHSLSDNDKNISYKCNDIKSHSIGCEYYNTKNIKIETRTSYGSVFAFRRDSLSGIMIETRTDCVFAYTHNSLSNITSSDSTMGSKLELTCSSTVDIMMIDTIPQLVQIEVTLWYIFVYKHIVNIYMLYDIIYTCDILFLYMYKLLMYMMSNSLKSIMPKYTLRCKYSSNLQKNFLGTYHLQIHLHFHSSMKAILSVGTPLDTNTINHRYLQNNEISLATCWHSKVETFLFGCKNKIHICNLKIWQVKYTFVPLTVKD